MSLPAIEVEQLGKRYRLGRGVVQYETLRNALTQVGRRNSSIDSREIWALRDVTLTVEEGESIGVIGRNGAGKTTLLKLLARITEPTRGMSRTRGHVGSLLEVGTGFHPELTGRDNIYLNGAIIGMSRREIQRRFDRIVDFAGVVRFLDTPLKRYSAGMQLRLAFSVAAHLEPDIVLVDEVLAVGDLEFQQRCLGRISELENEGRTVVFVSHDLGAVRRLCPRSVWLDGGRVLADGRTQDVMRDYLAALAPRSLVAEPPAEQRSVIVERVAITSPRGEAIEPSSDEAFDVRVQLQALERIPDLDAAIYLIDSDGNRVLDEAWHERGGTMLSKEPPARLEMSVTVPGVLAPGEYVVGVWVASQEECYFLQEVLTFPVHARADDLAASVAKKRIVRSPTGLQVRSL